MARRKKTNILPKVIGIAIGAGGGFAGDKLTTLTEKALVKTSPEAAQFAPAITVAAGVVGEMFVKDRRLQQFFQGMSIVSMVEVLGNIETQIRGAGNGAGNGNGDENGDEPIQGIRGYDRADAPLTDNVIRLNMTGTDIPTF